MNITRTLVIASSAAILLAILPAQSSEAPDIVWERQSDHHEFRVRHVRGPFFFPDGKRLVTGGTADGRLRIWNVADGSLIRESQPHPNLPPNDAHLWAIGVSPDGRWIASSHSGWVEGQLVRLVHLWDENLNLIRSNLHSANPRALSFSPDGSLLASGDSIFRTDDGSLVRTLPNVVAMLFSPNGAFTVGFNYLDSRLPTTAWNWAEGALLWTLHGFTRPPSFSPDGTLLALRGSRESPNNISLVDMASGNFVESLSGHPRITAPDDPSWQLNWIGGISFTPDGRWLAAISATGTVAIRDYHLFITLWDLTNGSVYRSYEQPQSHQMFGRPEIQFSPDGRFFAYSRAEGLFALARTPGWSPTLRMSTAGDHLLLSWPASVEDYTLEQTSSLASNEEWQPVDIVPLTIGNEWVVTLDRETPSEFYRLRGR